MVKLGMAQRMRFVRSVVLGGAVAAFSAGNAGCAKEDPLAKTGIAIERRHWVAALSKLGVKDGNGPERLECRVDVATALKEVNSAKALWLAVCKEVVASTPESANLPASQQNAISEVCGMMHGDTKPWDLFIKGQQEQATDYCAEAWYYSVSYPTVYSPVEKKTLQAIIRSVTTPMEKRAQLEKQGQTFLADVPFVNPGASGFIGVSLDPASGKQGRRVEAKITGLNFDFGSGFEVENPVLTFGIRSDAKDGLRAVTINGEESSIRFTVEKEGKPAASATAKSPATAVSVAPAAPAATGTPVATATPAATATRTETLTRTETPTRKSKPKDPCAGITDDDIRAAKGCP